MTYLDYLIIHDMEDGPSSHDVRVRELKVMEMS